MWLVISCAKLASMMLVCCQFLHGVRVYQEKTRNLVASAQMFIFWRQTRQQQKDDNKIVGADNFLSNAGTTTRSRLRSRTAIKGARNPQRIAKFLSKRWFHSRPAVTPHSIHHGWNRELQMVERRTLNRERDWTKIIRQGMNNKQLYIKGAADQHQLTLIANQRSRIAQQYRWQQKHTHAQTHKQKMESTDLWTETHAKLFWMDFSMLLCCC